MPLEVRIESLQMWPPDIPYQGINNMRKATFPYITYNYPKYTSIFIFLTSRKYEKTNQCLKESLKSVYSSFSLEPIPTYACQLYMPIHTYYN